MIKELLKKIIGYQIEFRKNDLFNDKAHFWGSYYLTLTLGIIFTTAFNIDPNVFVNIFYSFVLGGVATNILGCLNEFLEWKVFKSWKDPIWKKNRLMEALAHVFSGDGIWDWQDIKLNVIGSTIIIPLFLMFKHIFNPNENVF